jgi:hypothetical protein
MIVRMEMEKRLGGTTKREGKKMERYMKVKIEMRYLILES